MCDNKAPGGGVRPPPGFGAPAPSSHAGRGSNDVMKLLFGSSHAPHPAPGRGPMPGRSDHLGPMHAPMGGPAGRSDPWGNNPQATAGPRPGTWGVDPSHPPPPAGKNTRVCMSDHACLPSNHSNPNFEKIMSRYSRISSRLSLHLFY